MEFKFHPGDLVRVHQVANSKTPIMSIVGQSDQHPEFERHMHSDAEMKWYLCRWFWEGEFKTDGFREEELELVLAHEGQ